MDMRVLSYNIWVGGGDRLPVIARVLDACRPDVAALLEVDDPATATGLARDLAMEAIFGEGNGAYHVAWLSRLPVLACRNHRLSMLAKTLLEITVAWDGAPLSLFATHLASRHDRCTPAQELGAIVEELEPLRGRHQPHMIVGDFNALTPGEPVGQPPPGAILRGEAVPDAPRTAIPILQAAGYVDCFRAAHPTEAGFTYKATAPWLRIDYHFATPDLMPSLIDCRFVVGGDTETASDHLPLVSVLGRANRLSAAGSGRSTSRG